MSQSQGIGSYYGINMRPYLYESELDRTSPEALVEKLRLTTLTNMVTKQQMIFAEMAFMYELGNFPWWTKNLQIY